jgi:hypothetical protein
VSYQLRFDTDAEFGGFYSMLHYGVGVAAHYVHDRGLIDVEREAALADVLESISTPDPVQHTPAGSVLRQLTTAPASIEVDGDTLAMIDRYIRYAAERCGADWVKAAATALAVVRRAHTPPSDTP